MMNRSLFALVFFTTLACQTHQTDRPPAGPGPAPPPTSTQPIPPGAGPGGCVTAGCSGTACVAPDHPLATGEMATTCEFKPEYACYEQASCDKQADGACGWTQTPELQACLANPPAPQ